MEKLFMEKMLGNIGNDLDIRITFQNEDMETVFDEVYALPEYTSMLKTDFQRVISDVESLIYQLTGKPRAEWDTDTWQIFSRIRHKLLDKAGEVGRIPQNILEREAS